MDPPGIEREVRTFVHPAAANAGRRKESTVNLTNPNEKGNDPAGQPLSCGRHDGQALLQIVHMNSLATVPANY